MSSIPRARTSEPSSRRSRAERPAWIARGWAFVVIPLALASCGCATTPRGIPTPETARGIIEDILERDAETEDATFVGRFLVEAEEGQRRGSLRVRHVSPDFYRVDAFLSGVAAAGGGTSFTLEGDTLFTYLDREGGKGRRELERGSVVPFLDEFSLLIEDLESLAGLTPYLADIDLKRTRCERAGDGFKVESELPVGDDIAIWIDREKAVVTRALRSTPAGLPVVETILSRFERLDGAWRPARVRIEHFGRDASLSVQYEKISINEGLDRDDLLLIGTSP